MITIQLIQEGDILIPERQLTPGESGTVVCTAFNGSEVLYFQVGDELPVEETYVENENDLELRYIKERREWGQNAYDQTLSILRNSRRYSSCFARNRLYAGRDR